MAEGLRAVAKAYYERENAEERDDAKNFFNKLDLNKDGSITLEEFRTGFDSRPSGEEFFNKLDSDGDGSLDFCDVLVLFYHKNNLISISRCDGCDQKLLEPYFSCVVCLEKFPRTYDLCCDCHRGGRLKHKHKLRFMLHDQAALVKFVETKTQPAKNIQQSSSLWNDDYVRISSCEQNDPSPTQHNSSKTDMEELQQIAKAYYEASSEEIQNLAKDFFNSMDADGDGQVSLTEFLPFMSRKGYKLTGSPDFFKKLDGDGNGALDFWEVMTLYYVIKSGRPFCNCCGDFIPATFFSCVDCFKTSSSFDLCRRCFVINGGGHCHNGRRAQFLDNYTLLQRASAADHGDVAAQVDLAFRTLEFGLEVSSNFCTIL